MTPHRAILIPLETFNRFDSGQPKGIIADIFESVPLQKTQQSVFLKEHDPHELAIHASRCVCQRPVRRWILDTHLRWNAEVHGRTSAGTVSCHAGVGKLGNEGQSFRWCCMAQKVISEAQFFLSKRSVYRCC